MAINKVVYGGNTLIDLTDLDVTASDVASGVTFILADGTKAVGTMTETDPIFTSSELYGVEIRRGATSSATVNANSYLDVPITFSPAMSGVPTPTCTLNSSSTAGAIGSLSVAILTSSATKNGFTARIFNAGSTARSPALNWTAIYTP